MYFYREQMTCRAGGSSAKSFCALLVHVLFCLFILTGCMERNYKKEADAKVYKIIDQKWKEDYGSKANYKISDTPAAPDDIQVERAVPSSGVLSLSQAVALATAHNREYQTRKEELYIRALDLSLTRHEFDRIYFWTGSGGYSGDHNDEVIGREASFGFNHLLASGARISTRLTTAWVDVLSGNLESGLATLLNVSIIQPLLRGGDRKVVLENLTQAERDTLYEVRSFNRFRKEFVVSVVSQYYGVLELLDQVENARKNYNSLIRIQRRIEKLAGSGRVPLFELDRVNQERLSAFDLYIQAQKRYEQALDEFKITVNLPTTAEFRLDENELGSLRAREMSIPDFSEAEVIEAALLRRLDMANSADAVIDAQRKVYVAADALRGELNLVGGANALSERKADRTRLQPLREEYNLGFELDMNLDRVPEQHVYRKALITFNRSQREYDLAADTVRLQVRQAYRDLKEAAERHQVQLESLELAEKRFNKTYLLLQYGRANSRRVLNAQEDLFEAQNTATQTLVDYTIATVNFYRDTGILHVRPDGMWEY
jgi:outer membrane protein TolC